MSSIKHHAFHLRLESRQNAVRENRRAASMFMMKYLHFHILETTEGGLRAVKEFGSNVMVDRGCAQSPSDVTIVLLLNWIAPSTLKQKTKVSHVDIASILLNEHPNNIGISLEPMFAYKKGGVWQAQK